MSPRKKSKKPRERGSVTRYGDKGEWLARVRTGTRKGVADAQGKRQRSSESHVFKNENDAKAWVIEKLRRLDAGLPLKEPDAIEPEALPVMTLREFLVDYYGRTAHLSIRTAQDDLDLLRSQVFDRAPELADTLLADVNLTALTRLFRELKDGRPKSATQNERRPLSQASLDRLMRVLRARFNNAIAEGRLAVNPIASGTLKVKGTDKREQPTLTGEQHGALLSVLPITPEGVLVATICWTGCRPSEAAGALWSDFDLDDGSWSLQRALVRLKPTEAERGKGESWLLGPTKTRSKRDVKLQTDLVQRLRRHRANQAAERLAAGDEYENYGLVFASAGRPPLGRPLHLDLIKPRFLSGWVREAAVVLHGKTPIELPPASRAAAYREALKARQWQEEEAIKATGFPVDISLYGLRHSYITRLANSGTPLVTLSETVGHKNVNTTRGYIHPDEDARRQVAADMEKLVIMPRRLGIA